MTESDAGSDMSNMSSISSISSTDSLNSANRLVRMSVEIGAYAQSIVLTEGSKVIGGQTLPNGRVEITWLRCDDPDADPVVKRVKAALTPPVRDEYAELFQIGGGAGGQVVKVYEIKARGKGRQTEWRLQALAEGTQVLSLPMDSEVNTKCPVRKVGNRLRLCWRGDHRKRVRPYVVVLTRAGSAEAARYTADGSTLESAGRAVRLVTQYEDVCLYVDTQLLVAGKLKQR